MSPSSKKLTQPFKNMVHVVNNVPQSHLRYIILVYVIKKKKSGIFGKQY